MGVDSGLSVAKMLLALQPVEASAGVRKAADEMAEAMATLEQLARARQRVPAAGDARAADLRLDRLWGAIEGRLSTWAAFGTDDPDHERSSELMQRLFPTGLDFITLPFIEQHAQSDRRIQIIEQEGLREDLDHLVGQVFMDELLDAHAEYGKALGITKPKRARSLPVSLRRPLRALVETISRYALQLVAYSDLHPDNVVPALRALEPIDALRRRASRRSAAANSVTEPPSGEVLETEPPTARPRGGAAVVGLPIG